MERRTARALEARAAERDAAVSDYVICETALGWVAAVRAADGRVAATTLPRARREDALEELRALGAGRPATGEAAAELAGRLRTCTEGGDAGFTLAELDMSRGTEFQQAVWRTLLEIPLGETRSYAWVAQRIGRPRATRAVGRAVGSNPLPVIVPCHRVLASDGSLHGFGGGLPMKEALLRAEGAIATPAAV